MLDRRTLLAGLAASPLAAGLSACATEPAALAAPSPGTPLKLVTFNIWHNAGGAWPARLPLIVEELRAQDADVIALQEVLEDANVGLPNQAQTIADALGGYSVTFSSVDAEGAPRRYGNAILSRLPVLEQDWTKLRPYNDSRTAVRMRVVKEGRSIDVVNTHLHWTLEGGAIRAEQIADLLPWIGSGETPLIVMGDFNAPLEDSGLTAFAPPAFVSALPHNSAPTTLNPAKGHQPRVIDHIFLRGSEFAVESATVFATTPTDGEYASDHFGVAAAVRLL